MGKPNTSLLPPPPRLPFCPPPFASGGHWSGTYCEACKPYYHGPDCRRQCPGGVCNPCSSHGTCDWGLAGTGACTCESSAVHGFWTGAECDRCVEGVWGTACTAECPGGVAHQCYGHGACSDGVEGDGRCVCDASPATGYWDAATDCRQCRPGYWGPDCAQPCRGSMHLGGGVVQVLCAPRPRCAASPPSLRPTSAMSYVPMRKTVIRETVIREIVIRETVIRETVIRETVIRSLRLLTSICSAAGHCSLPQAVRQCIAGGSLFRQQRLLGRTPRPVPILNARPPPPPTVRLIPSAREDRARHAPLHVVQSS